MTGYARATGAAEAVFGAPDRATWTWEIKTVNAKALEVRCRGPSGFDGIEAAARTRIAARFRRGTIHAQLTVKRAEPRSSVRVNRGNLQALLAALDGLVLPPTIGPASIDGLLGVPGVVEVIEQADAGDEAETIGDGVLLTLEDALDDCAAMRNREGASLCEILGRRLDIMRQLVASAESAPGRTPEAVRVRLARRVADLAASVPALDPARLHAEAVLMAAKADIREELDRLALHVAAVGELLDAGGPVGRRLDFLAQELGREASTLCAKSNDGALTLIGLDLRTEIDQFREQVQNLE